MPHPDKTAAGGSVAPLVAEVHQYLDAVLDVVGWWADWQGVGRAVPDSRGRRPQPQPLRHGDKRRSPGPVRG